MKQALKLSIDSLLSSPASFLNLWLHKAVEKFRDRLNNDTTGKPRMIHIRTEILYISREEMGRLAMGSSFEDRAVLFRKRDWTA